MTSRLIGILATTLIFATSFSIPASASNEAAVMATLKQKYPSTVIKSVEPTSLPGIYEVVMGKNIAYVEESGRFFLFGHLFDMHTQTDLTEGKIQSAQSQKIDFSQLPLEDAVQIVRGDGSRKMAIFSDPDCPYCKQLEANMSSLTNVTIYLYLFPLSQLHPEAKAKSIGVWCSKDRAKAWNSLLLRNEIPVGQCDNPVERNITLATKLGINGTPTVILQDGTITPGAPSAARLEQMLNAPFVKVADK